MAYVSRKKNPINPKLRRTIPCPPAWRERLPDSFRKTIPYHKKGQIARIKQLRNQRRTISDHLLRRETSDLQLKPRRASRNDFWSFRDFGGDRTNGLLPLWLYPKVDRLHVGQLAGKVLQCSRIDVPQLVRPNCKLHDSFAMAEQPSLVCWHDESRTHVI